MKNLFTSIFTVAMLTLTAVPAFATTTPYVCPNGNTVCVQNGACPTNGICINHETCVANGVCQYPESCPNGGVPKHNGTGYQAGRRHGGGNSTGHCGGGRNR